MPSRLPQQGEERETARVDGSLRVLGIYPHPVFWSMGEGAGAPSFLLAPAGLARAGHRVVLVMPGAGAASGPAERAGIEIVAFGEGSLSSSEDPDRSRFLRFFARIRRYRRFQAEARRIALRVAREFRPDLVLGYDDWGVPVARAVAEELGVPNISRFFGTYLLSHLGDPFRLHYHFVPSIAYRTPAAYCVINDDGSGGERVALRLGVPAERIRFWRNGVDRALYRADPEEAAKLRTGLAAELDLPAGGTSLFTLSRLVREKHVERILAALPPVLAVHPRTTLVVIGEGPERGRLEAEARRLGVDRRVRWVGAVPRPRLPIFLNGLDVFVAMSDRTNGANPTYEAMICARPVVVLDTGETSRVVDPGRTGFLVPASRPQELGAVLLRVLADPEGAAAVGRRAREWALAELPTPEQRQAMEVELIERAAREWRAARQRP